MRRTAGYLDERHDTRERTTLFSGYLVITFLMCAALVASIFLIGLDWQFIFVVLVPAIWLTEWLVMSQRSEVGRYAVERPSPSTVVPEERVTEPLTAERIYGQDRAWTPPRRPPAPPPVLPR